MRGVVESIQMSIQIIDIAGGDVDMHKILVVKRSSMHSCSIWLVRIFSNGTADYAHT